MGLSADLSWPAVIARVLGSEGDRKASVGGRGEVGGKAGSRGVRGLWELGHTRAPARPGPLEELGPADTLVLKP